MTDFIGGYAPGTLRSETNINTPIDGVKIVLTAPDGVGDWAQELYDAIKAGQAAIEASLNASFSPHVAGSVPVTVTGGKSV